MSIMEQARQSDEFFRWMGDRDEMDAHEYLEAAQIFLQENLSCEWSAEELAEDYEKRL